MDSPAAPELHLAGTHSTGISRRIDPESQPARDSRICLWYDRLVGSRLVRAVRRQQRRPVPPQWGQDPQPVVVPDAEKRSFFYGINFELSYETPPFAQTPWALEIRPIIGVRNKDWEFIVNPIVDVDFSATGQTVFAPALRLARKLGEDRFIGMEYYENLGRLGNDQLYAVTDFKLGKVDVELGIGYGLTPESDRLVTKAIIGYAFPVMGEK